MNLSTIEAQKDCNRPLTPLNLNKNMNSTGIKMDYSTTPNKTSQHNNYTIPHLKPHIDSNNKVKKEGNVEQKEKKLKIDLKKENLSKSVKEEAIGKHIKDKESEPTKKETKKNDNEQKNDQSINFEKCLKQKDEIKDEKNEKKKKKDEKKDHIGLEKNKINEEKEDHKGSEKNKIDEEKEDHKIEIKDEKKEKKKKKHKKRDPLESEKNKINEEKEDHKRSEKNKIDEDKEDHKGPLKYTIDEENEYHKPAEFNEEKEIIKNKITEVEKIEMKDNSEIKHEKTAECLKFENSNNKEFSEMKEEKLEIKTEDESIKKIEIKIEKKDNKEEKRNTLLDRSINIKRQSMNKDSLIVKGKKNEILSFQPTASNESKRQSIIKLQNDAQDNTKTDKLSEQAIESKRQSISKILTDPQAVEKKANKTTDRVSGIETKRQSQNDPQTLEKKTEKTPERIILIEAKIQPKIEKLSDQVPFNEKNISFIKQADPQIKQILEISSEKQDLSKKSENIVSKLISIQKTNEIFKEEIYSKKMNQNEFANESSLTKENVPKSKLNRFAQIDLSFNFNRALFLTVIKG